MSFLIYLRKCGSSPQSFIVLITPINSLLTFVTMLALRVLPYTAALFNSVPSGPIAVVFAIIHQYIRLVPEAYHFKIFGVGMTDKIWVYALAVQVKKLLPVLFPHFDR